MLGNLDNEVIFKKAFTDKTVLRAFVRDILGIEFEVGIIETEKKFTPKIDSIDFKLDIFAESVDKRVVVELQRIEYDNHFDRFLHYFLMSIAEQQRKSESYTIERTTYVIVILTSPYTISEKNGRPIKDEVLLLKLNPKTIAGNERDLYGHQLTFLNPNYQADDTPQSIRDWLDLIYQSIHKNEKRSLNLQNEGIKKATELIDYDLLSPEEMYEAKEAEELRMVKMKMEKAEIAEIVKNLINLGVAVEVISKATKLSIKEIEKIRNAPEEDNSTLRKN